MKNLKKWLPLLGEIMLFILTLVCFIYSGWVLIKHQQEVMNFFRSLT